jgi:hypothetical protein
MLATIQHKAFCLPVCSKKYKYENIEDCNIACGSVLVRNLVSDIREEHRLKEFENRVLRRIFGPKTGEVTRRWRKMHTKELHDMYSSPSIIRMI